MNPFKIRSSNSGQSSVNIDKLIRAVLPLSVDNRGTETVLSLEFQDQIIKVTGVEEVELTSGETDWAPDGVVYRYSWTRQQNDTEGGLHDAEGFSAGLTMANYAIEINNTHVTEFPFYAQASYIGSVESGALWVFGDKDSSASHGPSYDLSIQVKTIGIDGLTSPPAPLDPPSIVASPTFATFIEQDGFYLQYEYVGPDLLNGEVFIRLPYAGYEIWTGTVTGWLPDYVFEEGEGIGVQHLGRGSKIVNGAIGFGSDFTEYPPGSGDTALQFRLKTSWFFCDVPPEGWEPTYRLGFGFTKPDWKTTSFAALLRPNMDDAGNEVIDSNNQWTPNIANQMFQDLAVGWLRSIGWTTVLGETESEGLLDGARLVLRSYLPFPINPDGRTGDFEFSIKTLPADAFTDAGITTVRCDHDVNIVLVDYGNPADDPFPAKYTRLQINGANTVRTANGMGSVNVRHGLVVDATVEVPVDSVNSAGIQDGAVLAEHIGFTEIDGGTW